jgi:hypothetical protein
MTCAFSGIERNPFLTYEGKPVRIEMGDYDLWRIVFDDGTVSMPFCSKNAAVTWLDRMNALYAV